MKLYALALLGLLWALPVQAQTICTLNCEIAPAVPVTVFTEADTTATRYVPIVNGAPSSLTPKVANGLVDFLAAGVHPFRHHPIRHPRSQAERHAQGLSNRVGASNS